MSVKFLVHHEKDNVGVAVVDIAAGVEADGKYRDQAGERTVQQIQETASGKLTKAELLNHREFVLTRLHRTA